MTSESSFHDAVDALPEIRGYKLLRILGHGGMSTVYLAEQESLGRKVALKVMLPEALEDEVSRRRFENEARTIARLDHPNIVGIFEVGRTLDSLPYYAMPYLGRGHLGMRITAQDGRTRDQARVIAILRALLAALDYAHVRGVVHRDVKAENVLFDEAERPLLADFGIALRKGNSPRVTMAGLAVGSTAYMAPEQARGEDVDSRADLYSVGVLAWEMLVGSLPYGAGDALSMAVMHAQDPVPRLPAELRHWQRFIDKALAKVPANRFRSAHQMLEALDRIERGGLAPDALLGNVSALLRRARRLPRGAWIGAGLAGAALLGLALNQGGDPTDFFRVAGATAPPPPVVVDEDPTESMLRPPPESPAQKWISAAEQQIAQRNLTAPAGANAYDSVLAAWRADPAHARMGATVSAVVDALGKEMTQRLAAGEDAKARDYLKRATSLAQQTGEAGKAATTALRAAAAAALQERVAKAEKRADRDAALAAAGLASEFTGDSALARTLRTRGEKIARPGHVVAGDPAGAVVVRGGAIAAMPREVTRGEYARFASATGRAASLCREKLSPLRIVARRSWQSPGFAQSDSQAVVCVSWADADAYARWLSSSSGHRYRLPTAAEWRTIGNGGGGARAVSEWLRDCGAGCRQRLAAGNSWRESKTSRPLDYSRGYDDVGFRLIREL